MREGVESPVGRAGNGRSEVGAPPTLARRKDDVVAASAAKYTYIHTYIYIFLTYTSIRAGRVHTLKRIQRCMAIESWSLLSRSEEEEEEEQEEGTVHAAQREGEREAKPRGEGWRAICGSLETVGTHVAPRA